MYYSALIGNPTNHSVSPLLYESLAKLAGLGEEYRHIKINLTRDELKPAIRSLASLHFVGANVTLPYKMDVLDLVSLDISAEKVGAVNTIKFGQAVTGYNTDWYGLYRPINDKLDKTTPKSALVFGSGGAAMAAIHACRELGFKNIRMACRDIKNRRIEKLNGVEISGYEPIARLVDSAQVIINATSTGMVNNDPYPFNINSLKTVDLHGKIFMDAVFNPLKTPLMVFFSAGGAQTIDGLWMMMYQGVEAMKLWLDQDLEISEAQLSQLHSKLTKALVHA